jgi:hypothetical protein
VSGDDRADRLARIDDLAVDLELAAAVAPGAHESHRVALAIDGGARLGVGMRVSGEQSYEEECLHASHVRRSPRFVTRNRRCENS